MNKYLRYLLLITITAGTVTTKTYSQDLPKELYSAAGIPDSLKTDANSVLRYSMKEVEVKGPGRETTKVHTITTILNEKGNNHAEIALPYNKKFASVGSFEMLVYDADGKLLKKYHKGDMYDHADVDDETLVTDDRFLEIVHTIASYPTTIELVYDYDNNSLIDLGEWEIQNEDQSIQNSYYNLSISTDAGFRYLNRNTKLSPQKTTKGTVDHYTWQVSNLKAIKLEEGAVAWRVLPLIRFAANKFSFYGIPGDISSWKNYGDWQKALNADVCSLTPQREAEIRKMTDSIKTDKGKAKFLYSYLQQNMRYVSVQLGIGGLKPFPAMFVDQKKYGDCKALSNYMVALLKAINIPAYYVKVRAERNEEPCDPAFPYNMSNHIIVCIPFKNDTTWLECTSSTQPFGKLGAFTENRNALLITEDGGKIVNTPKSKAEDNQFNSEVSVVLDADGGAKAQVKILATGEYRDLWMQMPQIKEEEQKEFILRYFDIKQPLSFNIQPGADKDGIKETKLNLEYDRLYDIAAGDKQFYHPHIFDLWGTTVPILDKRKTDYYFDFPQQRSCVTTIALPAGFEVETLPVNQDLKFTYGNYEVKYAYDATKNQVICTAKFNLNNNVIPAAKYTEMQQYMDAIAKAQNKKLVIRRKA